MRGARGISPALYTKAKGRKHDWGRAHATNIFTCIHSLIRTNLCPIARSATGPWWAIRER